MLESDLLLSEYGAFPNCHDTEKQSGLAREDHPAKDNMRSTIILLESVCVVPHIFHDMSRCIIAAMKKIITLQYFSTTFQAILTSIAAMLGTTWNFIQQELPSLVKVKVEEKT